MWLAIQCPVDRMGSPGISWLTIPSMELFQFVHKAALLQNFNVGLVEPAHGGQRRSREPGQSRVV